MYPDLSYLFHALVGSQPDNWLSVFKTFGFFLAIAFLVSAWVFQNEMRRKSAEGLFTPVNVRIIEGAPASVSDILINAVAGLIFFGKGVYAWLHFAQFKQDPASVILSSKMHWPAGLLGAVLFGGAIWLESRRKQKAQPTERISQLWPHDRVGEITVYAAVGGILGAKIFDLFDNWQSFLQDPLGALLSGGGLAFFGGLILGGAAVIWFLMRHKIALLPSADAAALAVTAGYGVGRIGCQLSGDGDWGIVNTAPKPGWMSFLPDWMWAYTYPHNVLNTPMTDPVPSVPIEGCTWEYCMQLSQPVFPTPFYETTAMAFVFALLWVLRSRIKAPGVIAFLFLFLVGIERFMVESIRVNVRHGSMFNLTQAELIAIGLMVAGVAGAWYFWKKGKQG